LQTKDSWEEYKELINYLARTTIRKWMIGVELEDVKQELWAEFFRVCEENEDTHKIIMIDNLRRFASVYKRKAGELKFGRERFHNECLDFETKSKNTCHWRKVGHLWEEYLEKLSPRDSTILRFAAQGASNATIANAFKLSVSRIEAIRSKLIRDFKMEVENIT